MPCAVAVPNSPIFSPAKVPAIFFKSPALGSPRIAHAHGPQSASSPKSTTAIPSPLSGRLRRPMTALITPSGSDSGAALKRKRPAMIDVPMSALSFAAAGSPLCAERIDALEADEESYSVICKRGRRGVMEDRYSAVVELQSDSRQAFFGVFDGHGGSKAAEFAAKNLETNISSEWTTRGSEEVEVAEAVKTGYLATDAQFLKEELGGGTCCVTALILKNSLVVSNAGDCRAVMSRGGVAEALTDDHRPSRKDEKDRIETLGGYVDCCNGVWRIQGSLAVSRAIGDRNLKQWVIAEPETRVLIIEPDCEFLILGSDGLWDKVNNQEAVNLVRPLCVNAEKPDPFSACKKLVDLSMRRGSTDDISVMIIQLSHFIS